MLSYVKFQSAYRRGHSTETALLRILNDLVVMSDGGNNALLVLLDLSAAFDTLDHTLLLQRLHAWVVPLLIGSHYTCHAGHSKSL